MGMGLRYKTKGEVMEKKRQPQLFDEPTEWEKEWKDMPEYIQDDLTSFRKIVVHFRNQADVKQFTELIGQHITPKHLSIWFPQWEPRRYADKRYVDEP